MSRKIKRGKYGLAEDVRGYQVSMEWQGRTLLGDVMGVEYNHVNGCICLIVRHFNREPWPIKPVYCAVNVLGPRHTESA